MSNVIYSRHYNIGFYGFERLHPFDSKKYGRAWRQLTRTPGLNVKRKRLCPKRPVTTEQLRLIHTHDYLEQLTDPTYLARALEVPQLARVPGWLINRHVLRPMRWATSGTILAAETALASGLAINLGGGFHHAKPGRGEGFCIYNDIAIAIESLRQQNRLEAEERIVYIDTDAHQGNGVCHAFQDDNRVFILDIYNEEVYPLFDEVAQNRIDCNLPIAPHSEDLPYLQLLQDKLPGFLDSLTSRKIGLAIYNAGTDIFSGDPLGMLDVSAQAICQRDQLVVDALRQRNIPTVMLLSGGYTKQSYQLVADSVTKLLTTH